MLDLNQQPEPVIKLENVSVRYRAPGEKVGSFKEYAIRLLKGQIQYNEFWALRDINLELRRGEIFGLIGRNGAGKSTVLKVISRVLTPQTGKVWIKGHVSPLLELGAGFHPELTGRENIYVNGTLLGHTRQEIEGRMGAILDFAEIGAFIDAPLRTYSSGMVARLGFAVATSWIPDILIVDEVLGVGDYSFQEKCKARMSEFRTSGTTILLVTHDVNTVRKMCNRSAWMDQGMIRTIGETEEVLDAYLQSSILGNWFSFAAGLAPNADPKESNPLPINVQLHTNNQKSDMCQINSLTVMPQPNASGLMSISSHDVLPFYASRFTICKSTCDEQMGIASAHFSTQYWFPVYDSKSMQSEIVISNPNPNQDASVDIVLSGVLRGSYSINPQGNVVIKFPGELLGPVEIISKNNVPIFASQRMIHDKSIDNVRGFAQHELDDEVWFPWYNSQNIRSWLVVANPNDDAPISISVDAKQDHLGDYKIAARENITLNYPNMLTGPFRIKSTDGSPILASQRVIAWNTFSEIMGFTTNRLATEFWFPWYSYEHPISSRLFLTNPIYNQPAKVEVFVGDRKQNTYVVHPGETTIAEYPGMKGNGPIRVVSINNIPVFICQRIVYENGLMDVTGISTHELSHEYWFPPSEYTSFLKEWLIFCPK